MATAAAGDIEVCGGRIGPVSEPDGLEGVAELTAVARDGAVCAATEDSTLVTRVDALDGLIPGAGLVDVLAGADVTGTGAGATAGMGAARVAGGRIDSAALAAPSASAAGERAVGDEVLVCVGDATGTVVSEPAELCPAANPSVTAGNELSKLAAADKGEVEVGAEETGCVTGTDAPDGAGEVVDTPTATGEAATEPTAASVDTEGGLLARVVAEGRRRGRHRRQRGYRGRRPSGVRD